MIHRSLEIPVIGDVVMSPFVKLDCPPEYLVAQCMTASAANFKCLVTLGGIHAESNMVTNFA
jgi:hypothetical protein